MQKNKYMNEFLTVNQFAEEVKVSVERLQDQLEHSGLSRKQPDDIITDEEKNGLLNYLRAKHGKSNVEKITLKRKTASEIRMPTSAQSRIKTKTKTVNVEFRKRCTYIKRSTLDKITESENAVEPEKTEEAISTPENATKKVAAPQPANIESVNNIIKSEKTSVQIDEQQHIVQPTDPADQTAHSTDKEKVVSEIKSDNQKSATKKSKDKDNQDGSLPARQELHVATDKSRRRKKRQRPKRKVISLLETQHVFEKPVSPIVRKVEIPENISVSDLAQKMSVKAVEVIKLMMELGSPVTINQPLDQETAALIVEEMGHTPQIISGSELEYEFANIARQDNGLAVPRSPVVTMMGHVDHGKTSLLDHIRNTRVATSEQGGITQHIGAYTVTTDNGEIVFLDTPGHAAFTAMRARGTSVTDIVILVVAADDGVMPQTIEVAEHAKKAGVAIIVAINKIDKDEAAPDRIKQELTKCEVISEEWGGDTQFVNVSAKTGEGIDRLIESIFLQAELLELRSSNTGPALGTVIEAYIDKGRGPVATILVREGALKKGDVILSGKEYGNVRSLIGSNGKEISSFAGPSTPVTVLGLSGIPNAGDEIIVVSDEKKAREIAELKTIKTRELKLAKQHAVKFNNAMDKMTEGNVAVLNTLIKADTHGSSEAIVHTLNGLFTDEVRVNIISSGVGGITETDISLAVASKAVVLGFNVRADVSAHKFSDEEGIDIRYYSIIYDLVDDIKAIMSGMLTPELRENIIGIAEVKNVFMSPKFGDIAGCIVSSGVVRKNTPIRVLRDNVVVYEGELESLRHFKDNVNEVKSGSECGIGVKNYNNIQPGDQIEVFERVEVKRTI